MKNGVLFYLIVASVYLEAILAVLSSESIPVTLFQIIFIVSFFIFVGYKLLNDDFEVYYNDYAFLLVIFIAIIFVSLIYSADRLNGFVNAIRFIVLVVFAGFLTNLIVEKSQIKKGLIFASVLCMILAAISMGESLFNPDIVIQNFLSQGTKLTRSAAGGIFNDPNRFAASLFIPLAFGFSLMNSSINIKYRIAGGIIFLMILGGVVTSYSRSGFLAVVFISMINLYYFKKIKPFAYLALAAIIVVFFIPSLRLIFFTYSGRIIDLITGAGPDASSSIRVMLGIAGIKMFLNSYGLGVGFDAFNEHFTSYFTIQKSIGVVEPHNITYTVLAELGVHGFFIFAVIVFFLFRDAINNIKKSEEVMDRIIAVTLFSSFCGYVIFYQLYGGGLMDNILMFNIALILVHKRFLLSNNKAFHKPNFNF
ncbi:MAG: O-antigen ligase family protein [Candidatus Paceibacterota bacterium]